jgi:SAM-dependent methyltransferase
MTTGEMPNTVVNLEQAQAWDGEEGARWTEHEDRYNAGVRRHTPHLLAAAHISATDQVLDIGCGCGESTRRAAQAATCGVALGVDLSARILSGPESAAALKGSRTSSSNKQTLKYIHSKGKLLTSPSADSAQCSLAAQSLPSRTLLMLCDRGDDWHSLLGRNQGRMSG